MIFLFFYMALVMSPSLLVAMEEEAKVQIHNKAEPLTQIVAKKIFEYQQGNRNVKEAIELLQSLPDPAARHIAQQKDVSNNTLMHTAAHLGNLDMITYLKGLGVDSRARNKWGETPVILAAKQGHIDCFTLLFTDEDLIEVKDKKKLLRYILAIPGQEALKSATEKIEESFEKAMIPLIAAGGDFEYFKSVVEPCEIKLKMLIKSIYNATRAGAKDHLELLLTKYPKYKIAKLKSVLYEATLYKQTSMVLILVDYGVVCKKALHCAVRVNSKKLAKIFCKKFPELVNSLDDLNQTPLYYAARNGFIPLINVLFKKGALPNIKNEAESALSASIDQKEVRVIQILLEHGVRLLDEESDFFENFVLNDEIEFVTLLLPMHEQINMHVPSRENMYKANSEGMQKILDDYYDRIEKKNSTQICTDS